MKQAHFIRRNPLPDGRYQLVSGPIISPPTPAQSESPVTVESSVTHQPYNAQNAFTETILGADRRTTDFCGGADFELFV